MAIESYSNGGKPEAKPIVQILPQDGQKGTVTPIVDAQNNGATSKETKTAYRDGNVKRWIKTVAEKSGWYGVTYGLGLGATELTNLATQHHINPDGIYAGSASSYALMFGGLIAVSEKIARKQHEAGHSPSPGAHFFHEQSRKKGESEKKQLKAADLGYWTETLGEEAVLIWPAAAYIGAKYGVEPAALFLGAGAVPTTISKGLQYVSLRGYKGEPIVFPKTREKLKNLREKVIFKKSNAKDSSKTI